MHECVCYQPATESQPVRMPMWFLTHLFASGVMMIAVVVFCLMVSILSGCSHLHSPELSSITVDGSFNNGQGFVNTMTTLKVDY